MKILIIGHQKKIQPTCIYLESIGHCAYLIRGQTEPKIVRWNKNFGWEDWYWQASPSMVIWPLQLEEIARDNLGTNIEKYALEHDIEVIINFSEHPYFLELENKLRIIYNIKDIIPSNVLKFFSSKAIQDSVCKKLDIPTIPNNSSKVILKYDGQGGGMNHTIIDKTQESLEDIMILRDDGLALTPLNEWTTYIIQNYIDIDYQISCHFYCDGNTWYHINNHIMYYADNCPDISYTSYIMKDDDKEIITNSIKKLSNELNIPNRLVGWQFVKTKDGKLYSTDFNARPFGGFEAGSYDTDVSDQNWINYLIGNYPPEEIEYNNVIECNYLEKVLFGYSELDRKKVSLTDTIKFKVECYD